MTRNPILDELHAARRKILADYNGDTAAYLRDAQARLEASDRSLTANSEQSDAPKRRNHVTWQWRISRRCPVIGDVSC